VGFSHRFRFDLSTLRDVGLSVAFHPNTSQRPETADYMRAAAGSANRDVIALPVASSTWPCLHVLVDRWPSSVCPSP